MKATSHTTTAGHSAFHKLILIISLYFGLASIAHRNPEVKRCRTHPAPTPDSVINDDDNNNIINTNDTTSRNIDRQQNACADQGANQRERKKKKRQLRNPRNDNGCSGTADEKRCTPHQDGIIHDKTKKLTVQTFTPIVVTKGETVEDPEGASILIQSHGATERHETLHPRPSWDAWLKQITNQNCCKELIVQPVKDANNDSP